MTTNEHSPANRAGAPVFKVGDRVRCVDPSSKDYGQDWTPNGHDLYVVTRVSTPLGIGKPYIDVQDERYPGGSSSNGWDAARFVLAQKLAPEPEEWTPGDGWREIDPKQPLTLPYVLHVAGDGATARYWVPEEPVPPLPTEPYTVIRATWRPGGDGAVQETYVRSVHDARWVNVNSGIRHEAEELEDGITGFEVLAAPPTNAWVPASVLDRVRDLLERTHQTRTLPDPVVRALTSAHREYATSQTRKGGTS